MNEVNTSAAASKKPSPSAGAYRRVVARRSGTLRRAATHALETLEQRMLLTTLDSVSGLTPVLNFETFAPEGQWTKAVSRLEYIKGSAYFNVESYTTNEPVWIMGRTSGVGPLDFGQVLVNEGVTVRFYDGTFDFNPLGPMRINIANPETPQIQSIVFDSLNGEFRLRFQNNPTQYTNWMSAQNVTASRISDEINALPAMGGAKVSVTQSDPREFVVAFSGANYASAQLLSGESRNGGGFYVGTGSLVGLTRADTSNVYYEVRSFPAGNGASGDRLYIEIPAEQASSFPIYNSPAFTPAAFFFRDPEATALGGFNSVVGTLSYGGVRIYKSNDFLMYGRLGGDSFRTLWASDLTGSYSPNGFVFNEPGLKPTFTTGSYSWELEPSGTVFMNYDRSNPASAVWRSQSAELLATGSFTGGAFTQRFRQGATPALSINVKSQQFTLTTDNQFAGATIAGARIAEGTAGATSNFDQAADRFTVSLNNVTLAATAKTGRRYFGQLVYHTRPGIPATDLFVGPNGDIGLGTIYRYHSTTLPFSIAWDAELSQSNDPTDVENQLNARIAELNASGRHGTLFADMRASVILRSDLPDSPLLVSISNTDGSRYLPLTRIDSRNHLRGSGSTFFNRVTTTRRGANGAYTTTPGWSGAASGMKDATDTDASSPIRTLIRSGSITVRNGLYTNDTTLVLSNMEMGRITGRDSNLTDAIFTPEVKWQTLATPATGDTFAGALSSTAKTVSGVEIYPAGSLFFWGQGKSPLGVTNVTVPGLMDLGTRGQPGAVITAGELHRLSFALNSLAVRGQTFTPFYTNGLLASMTPPATIAELPSYVVNGSSYTRPNVGYFTDNYIVGLGSAGTTGLRVFPEANSYQLDYWFFSGNLSMNGTRVFFDINSSNALRATWNASTLKFDLDGEAFVGVANGRANATLTRPADAGNLTRNTLDSRSVNVYIRDRITVGKDYTLEQLGGSSPLRIEARTTGNSLLGRTRTVSGIGRIDGKVGPLNLTSDTTFFPSISVDTSEFASRADQFSLGGLQFSGMNSFTLGPAVDILFPTVRYNGQLIAQTASGNTDFSAVSYDRASGTLNGGVAGSGKKIGDYDFTQKFSVSLLNGGQPTQKWAFRGQAKYYGTDVAVGTAGATAQVEIGGKPTKGAQLFQTLLQPLPAGPTLAIPTYAEISGYTIDLRNFVAGADSTSGGTRTVTLSQPNLVLRLGGTALTLNASITLRITATTTTISAFSGTLVANQGFSIGAATFTARSLSINYNVANRTLALSGAAGMSFAGASAAVNVDVDFSDEKGGPGLVVKDGSIQSFNLKITSSMGLMRASFSAGIRIRYDAGKNEFALYGNAVLSTANQSQGSKNGRVLEVNVTLGSAQSPGIRVVNGNVTNVDVSLSGALNLYSVTARAESVRVRYDAGETQLRITGGLRVVLRGGMEFAASLPGRGLLINTSTGEVTIGGLRLEAASIKLGSVEIKNVFVEYRNGTGGALSIAAGGLVSLPSGFEIGGSFSIVDGKLASIGVSVARNPGIQIAGGLINLYSIEGKISGLDDIANNFKLEATVKATVGPKVDFGGKSYALVDITGTAIITTKFVTLKGDARLIGGLFGRSVFEGTLDWNADPKRFNFKASMRLYPGDILRGDISANIDTAGNIEFHADMGVFTPSSLPRIGGRDIGRFRVSLYVRPDQPRRNSYARVSVKFLIASGSMTARFDSTVDWQLRINFKLFSIDRGGTFSLRDAANTPTVTIESASAIPGTPSAQIRWTATTPIADGTIIDFFADDDDQGMDGALIGSADYASGQQTFNWDDMSTMVRAGQPIRVYASIRDQDGAVGFSDYSQPLTVASGFSPTITAPGPIDYGLDRAVTFAAARNTAIRFSDPRVAYDPESYLRVTLDVGLGTLALGAPPDNEKVIVDGDGTSQLILNGTAADITAALDGLIYTPDPETNQADELTIQVDALPIQNSDGVTETVALRPEPLTIDMSTPAVETNDETQQIASGTDDQKPLSGLTLDNAFTSTLTAARVKIEGFAAGAELLSVPLATQFENGIRATFNPDSGVLTLTGYQPLERYESVLRAVEYRVKGNAPLPTGRSLMLTLSDDNGDVGSASLPLAVRRGHVAPAFATNSDGLFITPDQDAIFVAPAASLTLDAASSVTGVTFAFDPDSYLIGEDVLGYDPIDNGITGAWDVDTGVLTLSGTGTNAQWLTAIRSAYYLNTGAVFNPDRRDVTVTVTDDGLENDTASDGVVIIGASAPGAGIESGGPTLSLSNGGVLTLSGDEAFDYLDPALTLADPGGYLESATVRITSGYVYGEQELAAYSLWEGMSADFDPDSATLTITGSGTVAEYQDALRNVVLINTAGSRSAGQVGISMSVDNGLSAGETTAGFDANVAVVPFLDDNFANPTDYTTGKSTVTINPGVLIDFAGPLTGAKITIAGGYAFGQDQLIFSPQSGITGSFDAGAGVLTLVGTGSVAAYQAALQSIQYRNALSNPRPGDRLLLIVVTSNAGPSNEALTTINVQPVRVAPTIAAGAPVAAYFENGPPVAIAPNLTLADPDGALADPLATDGDLYGASASIDNYIPGQDLLSFVNTADITGTWDADNGTLLLNGRASIASYQAALRSIEYSNTSDTPGTAARRIELRLVDGDSDQAVGPAIATQVVRAIAEAPVLVSGTISPVSIERNARPTSLGMDDLVFAPRSTISDPANAQLYFTATRLPDEAFGLVTLADGTPLVLGAVYPVDRLLGITFTAVDGASGSDSFAFAVQMRDIDAGTADAGRLTLSVPITIEAGVTTTTNTQAYVAQTYRDLLGREPTASEVQAGADLIDSVLSQTYDFEFVNADEGIRSEFIRGLIATDEFRSRQVNTAFASILGRMPTPSELQAGVSSLAGGSAVEHFRNDLLASDEFYAIVGSNPEAFVDAVIARVLTSDADATIRPTQLDALDAGATRASVVNAIAASDEAATRTLDGVVTELLRRYADEADADRYFALIVSETDLITQIGASDEYFARYATASTAGGRVPLQVTNGYAAVGKVGDASGDKATGTLIAPQFVLVAAHSVASVPTAQLTFTVGGVVYRVDEVFIHPDFVRDFAGTDGASDIAILKLDAVVPNVTPARMIDAAPTAGSFLSLVGFGVKRGSEYGIKRVGSTPKIDQVNRTTFRWTYRSPIENNSTQGDSGAPLFMTYQGQEFVTGMVSGGRSADSAFGDIAVNTRVDAFIEWINSIVGGVTSPNPAPTIVSAEYNYDLATPTITVVFSDDVSRSIVATDLIVTDALTNLPLAGLALSDYDLDTSTATFRFAQTPPNARYSATLVASGIIDDTGQPLDGNNDGISGDDYSFEFFQLLGDANRDGTVNFDDLLALAANYHQGGVRWSEGDFDGDSIVNFDDLLLLASNYRKILPAGSVEAPPPLISSAISTGHQPTDLPEKWTSGPAARFGTAAIGSVRFSSQKNLKRTSLFDDLPDQTL
jgi:lipopolysaccharide export system protein LptA